MKPPDYGFPGPSDPKTVDKYLTQRVDRHEADNPKKEKDRDKAPDEAPCMKLRN